MLGYLAKLILRLFASAVAAPQEGAQRRLQVVKISSPPSNRLARQDEARRRREVTVHDEERW